MDPLHLLFHVLNFAAPALGVALLLTLAARILWPDRAVIQALWAQAALVFVAGVLTLGVGLWWSGQDGKMATYGALVAVAATAQWLLAGGWRR